MNIKTQRGETFSGYNELTTMVCPECGVLYAIPERMRSYAEDRGGFVFMWHCPNGHELGYGDDEKDKLRRRLEVERDAAARARARAEQAEAEARAQKAAKTRMKNQRDRERERTAAGVCPCCNRTFKQLARHMANQHPDFPREDGE